MFAIEVDGGLVAYRREGRGTPVVALHSSASSSGQWKTLRTEMADRHCVVMPDLPGYGETSERRRGGSSKLSGWADTARPIIALIEHGATPVHLVGHSYGGALAVLIAIHRPDLVRSLTLFEPVLFHFLKQGGAEDAALFNKIESVAGTMAAALADDVPDIGMAHFIDFWNGTGAWEKTPPGLREKLATMTALIVGEFGTGFAETWPIEDCARIVAPTLMLSGARSTAVSRRVSDITATAIPDVRHVELRDVGHMAPVTHPALVNPLVVEHIAEVERAMGAAPKPRTADPWSRAA